MKHANILAVIILMGTVGQNVQAMDGDRKNSKVVSEIYPSNLFLACKKGEFEQAIAMLQSAPVSEVFRRNVHGSMPVHFALSYAASDNFFSENEKEEILKKKRAVVNCCIARSLDKYSFVCNDLWPVLVCVGRGDAQMVTAAIKVAQKHAQSRCFIPGNPVKDLIFSQIHGRDQLDRAIINGSFDVAELLLTAAGNEASSWALRALEKSEKDHYWSMDRHRFLHSYIK